MKKRTIWILCIIMCFSSIMLITLQVKYINRMVAIRQDQFDDSVNRALSSVARNLELAEAKRYLEEDMAQMELQQQMYGANNSFQQNGGMFFSQFQSFQVLSGDAVQDEQQLRFSLPALLPQPGQRQNPSINNTSKERQELYLKNYIQQKELLDEVVLSMLRSSRNVTLGDRIDQKQMEADLKEQLEYNGIPKDLKYHYMVTNAAGRMVCSCGCSDFDPNSHNRNCYTQTVFGGDNIQRMGSLYVYFPTLKDYILTPVGFLAPSLSFIAILVVTFIFTLYLVLRQKKLTEIKNDFINNMTHEFKTPISTISLAAQMLNDESVVKSPVMFKHISGVINDEAKRLRFQVEKVLQMSMFDRQNTNLKMREVDMENLIEGVVKTFTLKVQNIDGTLEFLHDGVDNAYVMGDEMHLTNVIFNLLDNAVKYKRDDVNLKLVVTLRNQDDHLVVVVSDNGIGIKKEDVKKIFEKFYRVHTGNRHDVKGFGLGLAYVKKVVDAHNGTIHAESEYNKGTNFIITLPSCSIE